MRTAVRLLVSIALAAAVPPLRVWWTCGREPMSEACVWGKSFLPLSVGLALLFGAPVIFALILLVERMLRRRTAVRSGPPPR